MYGLGDTVMYGTHGICRINATETRKIDKKLVEYYVLEPIYQPGATYFVPIHNAAAAAKLQPVLSIEQLDLVFQEAMSVSSDWIPDENSRRTLYRELLNCGERRSLISMCTTVIKQRKTLLDSGKKFHQCDDNFLRDVLKMLRS